MGKFWGYIALCCDVLQTLLRLNICWELNREILLKALAIAARRLRERLLFHIMVNRDLFYAQAKYQIIKGIFKNVIAPATESLRRCQCMLCFQHWAPLLWTRYTRLVKYRISSILNVSTFYLKEYHKVEEVPCSDVEKQDSNYKFPSSKHPKIRQFRLGLWGN